MYVLATERSVLLWDRRMVGRLLHKSSHLMSDAPALCDSVAAGDADDWTLLSSLSGAWPPWRGCRSWWAATTESDRLFQVGRRAASSTAGAATESVRVSRRRWPCAACLGRTWAIRCSACSVEAWRLTGPSRTAGRNPSPARRATSIKTAESSVCGPARPPATSTSSASAPTPAPSRSLRLNRLGSAEQQVE